MRRDIYGGLKNAVERGEPIEKAIQSFLNAGYSDVEVREAADQLTPSSIALIKPEVHTSQQTQQKYFKPVSLERKMVKPKKPIGRIILLSLILIILLGALTATILFRQAIIDFISNML
jgi:hypothetical protein